MYFFPGNFTVIGRRGYLGVSLRHVHGDRHVLQELVVEGVDAVELENQVLLEDVLDAADAVLRLSLRQLRGLARLEQRAQARHLGDGRQLLRQHLLSGGRRALLLLQ